ncbi:9525_t:CDS:2, partial [Entrophospora sp. SA101]
MNTILSYYNNVLSLEIKEFHDIKIIAAGCQNGTLYLSIMKKDLTTGNYVQVEELSSSVVLPSSITSICIFSSSTMTCAVEQALIY